jgi:8-oxo-dGTP pyrophosphatase MutT (NUDIX family)
MNVEQIKEIYNKKPGKYIGKHKDYGILVPLVKRGDKLFVLFEERADELDSQPREICFPGGRIEKGEKVREGIIRETCEELEIKSSDIEMIVKGDMLHRYLNANIYSYIGMIDSKINFDSISNSEVKKIHLIELDELMSAKVEYYSTKIGPFNIEDFPYEKIGYTHYDQWMYREWDVPIIRCGGIIIWGLTAKFLLELLGRISD